MFFEKECCILCILLHSLQKNVAFFAFFYVLCKRMLHSLRSFPFFRKEWERTEWNVVLGLISRQNSKKERKRTECSLKERERTERSERKRMWCPTLIFLSFSTCSRDGATKRRAFLTGAFAELSSYDFFTAHTYCNKAFEINDNNVLNWRVGAGAKWIPKARFRGRPKKAFVQRCFK